MSLDKDPSDLEEPLRTFARFLAEAAASGIAEPNAMVLATSDADGRVSARVVLLKGFDERGFVFYTNLDSRKARAIEANPRVALDFFWRETHKQILVEGVAERVSDEEADRYFAGRPRDSQLGAWASLQSRPLDSREALLDSFVAMTSRYEGVAVPRPPHWSGFRIVHDYVEFWVRNAHRLHDRVAYTREGAGWSNGLLQP